MTGPEQAVRTDRDLAVDIAMGVYNGARFLPAQLESLAAQSHGRWRLICSDDGSGDDSLSRVGAFADRVPQEVQIRRGPGRGFAANYMAMIAAHEGGAALAFADQDDVWLPDKLARGVAALAAVDPEVPTLYCGRRFLWDEDSGTRRATPVAGRAPSFRNALIENIAPGNTILLNPAAARLARVAAARTGDVFAHDWWLYLLISGSGGRVIFDAGAPGLLYRQHGGNLIGGGAGLRAQAGRKWQVLQGAFGERLRGNLAAMAAVEDLLTPENRRVLRAFAAARSAGLLPRLTGLARVAPYRQSRLGSFGFWGAVLLGRV